MNNADEVIQLYKEQLNICDSAKGFFTKEDIRLLVEHEENLIAEIVKLTNCLETQKEIKFRLYNIDTKLTQIYTLSELISKTFRKGKFEFRGRFTGLKDKNNVEIYEGDILKTHTGWNHKVKWDDKDCGWNIDYIFQQTCKIIGNIWENKELINDS